MALDPLTAVADLAGTVINKIWPDKSAQEKQELAAAVMLIQSQLDINKVEAAHPSIFVSGWRPFIGWVCGFGCAWNWLGVSIAKIILQLAGVTDIVLTPASLTEMMPLLFGLLGLGTLRTVEKLNGKARL
tara:strand:+ start:4236 stop:4625 length:390 start_codon:yes stop_codon:yes gene_type:complete